MIECSIERQHGHPSNADGVFYDPAPYNTAG